MRSSFRVRALAVAVLLGASIAPTVARADDGAAGFGLAFGVAAGYALTALPYFLGRDSGPKGPAGDVSFGLGAGRRANAFAMGSQMGGALTNAGPFTYVARARIDIDQSSRSVSSVATRLDGVVGHELLADRARRTRADLVLGVTFWPSFRDTGDTSRPYAAVGPLVGIRLRVATPRPYFYSEAELDYVALFGRAPTGRTHHVDVVATLGFSPWPSAFGSPAFELRLKREIGVGAAQAILGDDTTANAIYGGTSLLLGMRFSILNREY